MARCVWKCAAITRVLPTSLTPEYPPPPNVLTPTPAEVQRASDGALSTALHVLRQPNSNAIANVLSPSHSRCPFGDARRPSVRLRRSIPSSICACALRPAAALGEEGALFLALAGAIRHTCVLGPLRRHARREPRPCPWNGGEKERERLLFLASLVLTQNMADGRNCGWEEEAKWSRGGKAEEKSSISHAHCTNIGNHCRLAVCHRPSHLSIPFSAPERYLH